MTDVYDEMMDSEAALNFHNSETEMELGYNLNLNEQELKDLWTACVYMFDEMNGDDFNASAERYEWLVHKIDEAIKELRKEK